MRVDGRRVQSGATIGAVVVANFLRPVIKGVKSLKISDSFFWYRDEMWVGSMKKVGNVFFFT